MLEKLIWISTFMLVGARHPGATVGGVEKEYRSEVSILYSITYLLRFKKEKIKSHFFLQQDDGEIFSP